MNDDEMLAAMRRSLTTVKDSLTNVHLDRPAEAIIGQARSRRLRRVLPGIAVGGLALGIGLALALPGSPSAARPVHVNLEAWSVNTTSAGLINVTIRELKDPAQLRQTLADAGVPVRLTFGQVCTPASGNLPELSQVLHKMPGRGDVVLAINPAAMSAGTELVIGIGKFQPGSTVSPAAAFGLMRVGSQLDCQAPQTGSGSGGVKTGIH